MLKQNIFKKISLLFCLAFPIASIAQSSDTLKNANPPMNTAIPKGAVINPSPVNSLLNPSPGSVNQNYSQSMQNGHPVDTLNAKYPAKNEKIPGKKTVKNK